MLRRALVIGSCLWLGACARTTVQPDAPAVAGDGLAATRVEEAFVSSLSPADNIDSIATWTTPEGGLWLIATAKDSGRLVVFDGDSGATLRSVGGPGTLPGQFSRPNGIAVFADLVFVVERDNHRVQVLELPDFAPLAVFGADVLRTPYGLWVHEVAPFELELHVTDSYQQPDRSLPPLEALHERVRVFRVRLDEDRPVAELVRSYGDTSVQGAIRWIESIVGDPAHDRVLIPEEYVEHEPGRIRIYDTSGHYTGRDLGTGLFGGQPEGLALFDCADGSGYWITTDQQNDSNRFHLFDRRTLAHLGTFRGDTVQFTDGVALHAHPTARFPSGAFFAVHRDQGVVGFDWQAVSAALELRPDCAH